MQVTEPSASGDVRGKGCVCSISEDHVGSVTTVLKNLVFHSALAPRLPQTAQTLPRNILYFDISKHDAYGGKQLETI